MVTISKKDMRDWSWQRQFFYSYTDVIMFCIIQASDKISELVTMLYNSGKFDKNQTIIVNARVKLMRNWMDVNKSYKTFLQAGSKNSG